LARTRNTPGGINDGETERQSGEGRRVEQESEGAAAGLMMTATARRMEREGNSYASHISIIMRKNWMEWDGREWKG